LSQFTFSFTFDGFLPGSVGLFPLTLTVLFLLLFGLLSVRLFLWVSLSLFRAEVSAPLYQSVGHSGADQSISGAGSFRGEGSMRCETEQGTLFHVLICNITAHSVIQKKEEKTNHFWF